MPKFIKTIALLAGLFAASATPASAQGDYPQKPVTWVVSYAPGGLSDSVARIVAEGMQHTLGQAVVIDNKPGGSTIIGTQAISRATPDGYTIGSLDAGTLVLNLGTFATLPYDPAKDFDYVGLLGRHPFLMITKFDSPFNSVEELIEYGKAHPDELNFGSPGIGSSQHISLQSALGELGVPAVHVPYQGGAPALQALLGGQIQLLFVPPAGVADLVATEKVKVLAVTDAERLEAMPNVPTLSKAALPGFVVHSWQVLGVPAGSPAPVVETLSHALSDALQNEAVQQKMSNVGMSIVPMSREEISAYLQQQNEFWLPMIEKLGLAKQ